MDTMTKEEFIAFKEAQRQQAAYNRIKRLAGLGECEPLTDDEWLSIETKGKTRFKNKLVKQSSFKK
jgi:hypothetical protein